MEPVMIVVTALIAGAAAGASDVASSLVKQTYESLKSLVMRRFRAAGVAEETGRELIANASDQEPDKAVLVEELTRAQVDDATVETAQKLLQLLEAMGDRKFHVEVRDSTGVIVGDHNSQTININQR